MNTLNITIGPVQGFVTLARRTRDLWSGSFILSYLSGCAMLSAEYGGGLIKEPVIEDNQLIHMIKYVKMHENKNVKIDTTNLIGSLPNRFKIECEDPEMVAQASKEAFDNAWNEIAEAVWDQYLKDITIGKCTRVIWERQVENFWEFNWTVGTQKALEGRKNWRRQNFKEEGGDHCTLMGDHQELSGFTRFKQRDEQDKFWKMVSKKTSELDLQGDERLCAIAFIKRFFPKVVRKAIRMDLSITHWPSTVYMAAVPWLKKLDESKKEKMNQYYDKVAQCGKEILRRDIPKSIGLDGLGKYTQLDGNFYFRNLLRNKKATPLKETPDCSRNDLMRSLVNFGSAPSVYYTLLLMDGDNLGKIKKENKDKVQEISHALSDFSKTVPKTVRNFNGVTIYAGGDDVLAMLPMDTAMSCAEELSKQYNSSFNGSGIADTTISAGLVYSHYHQPLQLIYHESHHLLDDIAKEENGRNSIAVSVLKGSGKYLQWVSKWEGISMFSKALKQYGDEKTFSSSLLYSIRELLSHLTDIHNWQPGQKMEIKEFYKGLDLKSLIVAEILSSRKEKIDRDTAERKLEPLLEICYREDEAKFLIDGWFLVRFLYDEGVRE